MSERLGKNIKQNMDFIICLLGSIFFFFLIGERGYVLSNDSGGYTTLNISRSPVYQWLVTGLRSICGDGVYMNAVTIAQGVLGLAAVICFTWIVKKTFRVNQFFTILIWICTLLPYGMSTLLKSTPYIYTHTIQTEGITYSLSYFLFIFIILFLKDHSAKMLLLASTMAGILALTRPQLIVTYGFVGVAVLIDWITTRKWKKVLINLVLLFAIFVIQVGFERVYQKVMFSASSTVSSSTLFNRLLYASDLDDIELFKGTIYEGMMTNILSQIDDQGLNHAHAPERFIDKTSHIGSSYDEICFEITMIELDEFVHETYGDLDVSETEEKYSLIQDELINILKKEHLGDYLCDTLIMIPDALVNSVFLIWPPMVEACFVITGIVYILALVLSITGIRQKERKLQATCLLVVTASGILNSVAVCFALFPQDRYLMYTIGVFYSLLFVNLYGRGKGERAKKYETE